jgi:4-amino-4-deoxy-L-arabinose transferase-like glycosyltransferase
MTRPQGYPRVSSWRRPLRAPFDLLVLAVLALWLLGVGYGLREPWPADEPRFALMGQDMVETGRWWVPHRGPELYAEKPPVFIWMQAASYALAGDTRLAFLLPSLLAAFGTLALVWDLLRRVHGRGIAFWGTAALLFCFQFTLQGRTAQIDMVLVLFTTIGLYGLLRHLLIGPAWGWFIAAGLATGLGVITKGTGFLPWLMLIPYGLARTLGMHGLARFHGGWRWALGPLALFVPILLWALPLLYFAAQPGNAELAAYRDDLLFNQTVNRYTDSWGHLEPWWYYVVEVIPFLWLPLTLLLPWAVPAWWRRIRRGDARPLLLLGWVALVVLFFSLSPGKRGVYLLPAVPALVLALAPLLPGLYARRGVQRAHWGAALVITLVLGGGAAWALIGAPAFEQRLFAQNGVAPWGWLFAVGALALAACLALWRRGVLAFAAVMGLLWSGYGLFGYPDMDGARSGRTLMQRAHELLPEGAVLGLVAVPEQFLLQAVGNARSFGFKTSLEHQRHLAGDWLRQSDRHWILIQRRHKDECIDPARAIEVGWSNRRHWFLVDAAGLRPDCAASESHEVSPLHLQPDDIDPAG